MRESSGPSTEPSAVLALKTKREAQEIQVDDVVEEAVDAQEAQLVAAMSQSLPQIISTGMFPANNSNKDLQFAEIQVVDRGSDGMRGVKTEAAARQRMVVVLVLEKRKRNLIRKWMIIGEIRLLLLLRLLPVPRKVQLQLRMRQWLSPWQRVTMILT